MTLEEMIEGFRQKAGGYDRWDTPSGANGACYGASYQFACFCASHGAKVGLLQLGGPKFKPDSLVYSPGHYVTWIKDFEQAVDWTGRQYRFTSAYPLITTLQMLKDEWTDIEVVKYINEEGLEYERAPA
jgi:hypothetical protein